ncbi:1-acyl-sn-glycerol-3-phosphate acyltransferase [Mucilaginibacter ginsenosidivorax]|uniref:1-acyl-sn-glycerol-3-phosphate acyltransferase n=2 Tax=Mucilaginibacter ginsenosidivorax TaxID=862126 RepID=A0A5B8VWH2_9SPHI|nr:1-acyl-sn-glycerol-3-phosphate acyltransferase [Mucilaginibacter ginsenosidivorax]
MKMILKKVHIYLYVMSVALSYFLLWPFFKYFSKKPARYHSMNKLRRAWGFISSALVGILYNFEYEEPVDWSKTYIICPNHTSNLDISAMCILVNSNCSFMGKQELEDGLVTGIFFRSVDIAVNRESKMSSFRAFKKASEKLKEGVSLVIFPEGMISDHYPPKLCEFKSGPFRLAIEHKIPIIPVTSVNTWEILWDTGTKYGSRPGICHFYVHKPIDTSKLTTADADTLRDDVYAIIQQKLATSEKLQTIA